MGGIELKPCPFCGGQTVYAAKENVTGYCYVGFNLEIKCKDCGISLPGKYKITFCISEDGAANILDDERPIAAGKWNNRVEKDGAEE